MTAGNISMNQDLDFDSSYRFGRGENQATEPDRPTELDEEIKRIEKKFGKPGLSAK